MADQDFCINLVKTIQKYPCLYNHNTPDYARKDVVDKAWVQVANELNEDVPKCKTKWRNIRTVFARQLKGMNKRRIYYLHDMLQFLLPFVKGGVGLDSSNRENPEPDDEAESDSNDYLETTSSQILSKNFSYDSIEPGIKLEVFDEPTTDQFENRAGPSVWQSNLPEKVTPQIVVKSNVVPVSKKVKLDSSNYTNIDEDPKRAFLISLLPDLKSMDVTQMRRFKRKVLELVDDILGSNVQ